MNAIDLFFTTGARADFLTDLLALGLAAEVGLPGGGTQVALIDGIELDYVGQVVEIPATYEPGEFLPVELTPATFFFGDRANLRLTGPEAAARALVLSAAMMEHTTLLATEDVPAAQIRWSGGGIPWAGSAEVPPPPAGEDLETAKARLIARLAQRRWEVETGGVSIGGNQIKTDRESISMLGGALQLLGLSPEGTTVQWKTSNGFVTLDLDALQTVALAVGGHVQACFGHEATLWLAIGAAESAEALDAIATDVEAFSP